MSGTEHKQRIEDLVSRYTAGDEDAFEELYHETVDDLTKYCFFRFEGISTREAEDIIQTTYLKITKNIHTLKDPGNFMAWAYQIVRTTGINYLKKEQKYVYAVRNDEKDNWAERIPDDSRDSYPDESVFAQEVRKVIIESLKCLGKASRKTFCMFYFDHMKIDEIAKAQGISPGTVKSRLFTARERLRKRLETFRDPKE